MDFTTREAAHVLAALRLAQGQDISGMPHFEGGLRPLSDDEVNDLCERISCGPPDKQCYTVVGIYLDTLDENDVRDATFCDCVTADTPLDAVRKARLEAAERRMPASGHRSKSDDEEIAAIAEDIVILAVFAGDHSDLYDPATEQQ